MIDLNFWFAQRGV